MLFPAWRGLLAMNFMGAGLGPEQAITSLYFSLAPDKAGWSRMHGHISVGDGGRDKELLFSRPHSQQNAVPHLPILKHPPASKPQLSAQPSLTFPIPSPES